jgi:hypothetical protein
MGFTCKIAEKEYRKKYYLENKERFKEKSGEYRNANREKYREWDRKYKQSAKGKQTRKEYEEANREKVRAWQKKYRDANKEKARKYYEDNKERMNKYNKKYILENREKVSEKRKRYRETNKERIYKKARKYRQTDQGKATEASKRAIRRALKKKQSNPNTDKCKVKEIYKVWDDVKRKGYNVHVDHIIPIARGGDDHEDNLMIVDAAFNMKKRHKLNSEIDFYPEEEFQFLDLFLKEYLRMNLHLGE